MDELIAVQNALSVEMQDCYNQNERQTAETLKRLINAISRAMAALEIAGEVEAAQHLDALRDAQK